MLRLVLTGDVMPARGIDQILRHPCAPRIYEKYVQSAEEYVWLAEKKNGPIPRGAAAEYVWGDALEVIGREATDLRIINLETAITTVETPAFKGINYRMSPGNADVITAFRADCCVLANNHVLDWGEAGLEDTLRALRALGPAWAGAGANEAEAAAPAVLAGASGDRVLVFAFATSSSGVPAHWAATARRPGVNLLPDLQPQRVHQVAAQIAANKRDDDVTIASIHWGGNWGYDIGEEEIAFARALIDEAGVDIVHGHSSHHPKALEVWKGRLILYGCGDFLNDYEGIGHYQAYRDELVLAYMADIARSGELARLSMLPFHIRQFRLNRPIETDIEWLRSILSHEYGRFGLSVERRGEKLSLR